MHPALESVKQAITGTPYQSRVWLVGGAVRDALLGLETSADFDLVTDLDALELAQLLHVAGASEVQRYARFGTAMVEWSGARLELATARRESYAEDSRKPHVEPASLEEDAARRDFTVNAILRNLDTGELFDPLGVGVADLQARTLRTPLDPASTFRDDPLRMLRAVRFVWKLGFVPAAGLYDAIAAECHRIDIVSAERIRDEWTKMLLHPTASSALRDLLKVGLLERFAPELVAMAGVEQGNYHHLDVWDHSLLVLDGVKGAGLLVKLASLLHDVGKPATRSIGPDGAIRFYGHEAAGAEIATALLRRLRFSESDAEQVARLVKNHMRLGSSPVFSPTAARRLIRDLGSQLDDFLTLVEADASALDRTVRKIDLGPIRAQIDTVLRETPAATLRSPLTGSEIMTALRVESGPEVGKWKSWLEEQVISGRLSPSDKDGAMRLLQERQTEN